MNAFITLNYLSSRSNRVAIAKAIRKDRLTNIVAYVSYVVIFRY
jgi:hypothetical protein